MPSEWRNSLAFALLDKYSTASLSNCFETYNDMWIEGARAAGKAVTSVNGTEIGPWWYVVGDLGSELVDD